MLPPSLQDSLPAGWLSLYREGVEPSGSLQKVSDHPSSFSGLGLAQGKFHFEPPFTSFDHLVGGGEQRRRHREAERSSSLMVNDQLELRRLHHQQVAPSASIVFGLGRRGGVVGKPRFQLRFDLDEIVGLGLEVARMGPLEARLQQASNPPIGIAEVIVDGRILGLSLIHI